MLPTSFTGEVSVAQTGAVFIVISAMNLFSLNVLIDVDPTNTQIPIMSNHVVEKLKQRSWYSTQEVPLVFLPWASWQEKQINQRLQQPLTPNGKTLAHLLPAVYS